MLSLRRSGLDAQRRFVKYEHQKCCGAERPSYGSYRRGTVAGQAVRSRGDEVSNSAEDNESPGLAKGEVRRQNQAADLTESEGIPA